MVRNTLYFERRSQDVEGTCERPEGPASSLSSSERETLERVEAARWFRARNVDERMNCVQMWAMGLLTFAARDDEIGYALSAKGVAALH